MEASTVQVRVQVIDLASFTLDLQVPTYLPARDLTQRVARDAGLEAHWPDGRRRLYWLRARGRLLGDDEKLADLGVIAGELVYLLPEPPAGSGVVEQPPEYPETHPYLGAGWFSLSGSLAFALAWAIAWGVALAEARSAWVVTLPGLTLGFLCTSLARHGWGGRPNRIRVASTGLVLVLILTGIAFVVPVFWRVDVQRLVTDALTGGLFGVLGLLTGWLAWWGAVEPLPAPAEVQAETQASAVALVPCGVCGQGIEPTVRIECPYRCGQHFHQGCHRARVAVHRGEPGSCAVCGRKVA